MEGVTPRRQRLSLTRTRTTRAEPASVTRSANATRRATASKSDPAAANHQPSVIDSDSTRRRSKHYRAWDDAPLQVKVLLLILTSMLAGVFIGFTEAWMNFKVWPMLAGGTLIALLLFALGKHWVVEPFIQLCQTLERAARQDQPSHEITGLPLSRHDEIGRLARIMHQVHMHAARDWHEARRLRRTLDHRIQRATEQATSQLRRIAMRDSLTEAGNRRFLEENLPPLFDSARVSGTDLVSLAIDLDNFKSVNDTLGHAAGDELLIFITSLMQASVRQGDYVIRQGGDEFLILLPGGEIERASALAEQIIALFRQHVKTALPDDCRADLSVGIASIHADAVTTPDELLSRADERLYSAKRQGKGRVVAPDVDPGNGQGIKKPTSHNRWAESA